MSRRLMNKKKYYPNNWDLVNSAPADFFPRISYEEFMDWKVMGWEIPSSVCCIMRAEDRVTGKISEHVYSKPGAAKNKIEKLLPTSNVTVAEHEAVHLMKPTPFTYLHDHDDFNFDETV